MRRVLLHKSLRILYIKVMKDSSLLEVGLFKRRIHSSSVNNIPRQLRTFHDISILPIINPQSPASPVLPSSAKPPNQTSPSYSSQPRPFTQTNPKAHPASRQCSSTSAVTLNDPSKTTHCLYQNATYPSRTTR